jgi:hypothetical protein
MKRKITPRMTVHSGLTREPKVQKLKKIKDFFRILLDFIGIKKKFFEGDFFF